MPQFWSPQATGTALVFLGIDSTRMEYHSLKKNLFPQLVFWSGDFKAQDFQHFHPQLITQWALMPCRWVHCHSVTFIQIEMLHHRKKKISQNHAALTAVSGPSIAPQSIREPPLFSSTISTSALIVYMWLCMQMFAFVIKKKNSPNYFGLLQWL